LYFRFDWDTVEEQLQLFYKKHAGGFSDFANTEEKFPASRFAEGLWWFADR
jgi:hypothetical protein